MHKTDDNSERKFFAHHCISQYLPHYQYNILDHNELEYLEVRGLEATFKMLYILVSNVYFLNNEYSV